MDKVGTLYYYETRGGAVKHATLIGKTPAWYMFDNGDWLERYLPLYRTLEELKNVRDVVQVIYDNTSVPNCFCLPGMFSVSKI